MEENREHPEIHYSGTIGNPEWIAALKRTLAPDMSVRDFPKLKSPFIRHETNHGYFATPEIEPGYEWVFEDAGVLAVDKLHGTNCCVIVQDGVIRSVDNRTTRVLKDPVLSVDLKGGPCKFFMGVANAAKHGYFNGLSGRIYGELIGPDINGNMHKIHEYLFVPFPWLADKCMWHSWVQNKYPKTFDSISDWFKELPSLYSQRHGHEVMAEGLIFLHPEGRMAKLRRDMFPWHADEKREQAMQRKKAKEQSS